MDGFQRGQLWIEGLIVNLLGSNFGSKGVDFGSLY